MYRARYTCNINQTTLHLIPALVRDEEDDPVNRRSDLAVADGTWRRGGTLYGFGGYGGTAGNGSGVDWHAKRIHHRAGATIGDSEKVRAST